MTNGYVGKTFSPETLQLLFSAINEDDLVDENVSLPPRIDVQCTQDSLRENYALCLQYWEEGVDRHELLHLVRELLRGDTLSDNARMQFKYIRSRYKHLRFAQRLYSKKHLSRLWFSKTTVLLGKLQDAFRNSNIRAVKFYAGILCFYLSKPIWNWVYFSLRDMPLDSASHFIAYRKKQIRKLQVLIAKTALTGREFHAVRKIVSQQVSYYDTLRSIDPGNQDFHQISRFLAAINGVMGDKHDEMVADNLSGRRRYDELAQLDIHLRQRLELLLARYPL
ncbi:hypothetical protein [Erwinia rhapontici]|uniref:hypothetical protein n=1 Tax=Erwinia rhapontici TaxID=55212 RepID=UPI00105DF3CE|nr:hypothetical protein [Erwinia rhapontici]TDT00091.1 hypothetical protein EDF84_103395 [Erwinia rhapontici]